MKRRRVHYDTNLIHWIFNGKYHRDVDLPAKYYFWDGKLIMIVCLQHGKVHRTTGPAYIKIKGKIKGKIKEYYYQGKQYASLEKMLMLEACR